MFESGHLSLEFCIHKYRPLNLVKVLPNTGSYRKTPYLGTWYYLRLFFEGRTRYQMQLTNFRKIFRAMKWGFCTGINTQKIYFFEFFLNFLGT